LPSPTINIVVLNYNTRNLLQQCLPIVIRNSQYPGATITVVDNASTDGSAEFMSGHYPEIRFIQLSENTGYAGGYNEALKQCTEDYFVLLNSDAEPDEQWLSPLLELVAQHPDLGAAQPHLIDYYKRNKFEYAGAAGGFIDKYGYPFCRGRIFGNVETNQGQYNNPMPIFWASGAALFIKREAWERATGLDLAFFAHMEEIDLCWRLQLMGYSIWSCPDSRVFHIGGATLSNQSPRKTFLNFRNNLLMLHKNLHPSEKSGRILARKLLDGLAGVFFMLQGKWSHIPQIVKAHREFDRIKSQFPATHGAKTLAELNGSITQSIVIGYFTRGKKTWQQWQDPKPK
jgi:GT2 family glycosyltransferase